MTQWKQGLVVSMILLLQACAAPVTEQSRVGFISDYSRLEKVADNAFRYTSPKVKAYTRFLIDEPEFLFEQALPEDEKEFSDAELEELSEYFVEHLEKVLTEDDGYEVVQSPGQGVARLRIGITALDATNGVLNVTIYTKVTGAGLGGAAMEGELLDSISNEQLAAAVQWGNGSRVLRAGFTKSGDAKLQINRWTRNLRERIDSAHGRSNSATDVSR